MVCGCLSAAGALGCSTTPLDSVIAEGVNTAGSASGGGVSGGSSGMASSGAGGSTSGSDSGAGSGGSAGSSDCQIPGPGRYQIRDRVGDRCMQQGEPDPTLYPVYHALLDGDCSVPDAEWDLYAFGPSYILHNVGIDANLDVRAGSWTDATPIVLYMPRQGSNQVFTLHAHTPPYFALEPLNAPTKCVEAVGAAAQLFPCDDTNRAQDFNLVRVDCP